ncbi:MAG: hypothetical protein VB071_15270 [Lawsonibacter sp.]|nr:hypothetical protein [Lawsonibacter sp.]
MEKHRTAIRAIFWTFLVLGSALLGVGLAAFHLDRSAKNIIVGGWFVFIVLTAVAIDLLWYRELWKQVEALRPFLTEDPDYYIREIRVLLEGKRSPHLRGVLLVNLSAAYQEKRDYQTAVQLLHSVNPKKLTGINRSIYWADLANAYFYLGENSRALDIMAEQEFDFSKLTETTQLGGLLAILSVFQMLASGNRPGAKQRLEQLRPRWEDPHNSREFEDLERRCQEI